MTAVAGGGFARSLPPPDGPRTPPHGDRPMLPGMRRPISSSGWMRALALPLALWSAIPGVQWCSVGWADVRLECFAECSIERSEDPGSPCPAGAGGSCGVEAQGCPAGLAECALGPCNADGGSSEGLPGGRAYCLSGPTGGDAVPPVPLDAAPPLAIVPSADWDETPADGVERPIERTVARPPTPAIGAVPRIRAPPESGSTTC